MLGEEAFHPDTRALIAYGRALASGRPAAQKGRADHVLERLFVIEKSREGRLPVRSFGAELVSLLGRDLRQSDFAALWLAPDRVLVLALVEAAAAAAMPAVARAVALSECGARLGVEMLITPLAVETHLGERFLGLIQPLGGEAFFAGRRLARFKLAALYPPEAKAPAGVRLVVSN